MWKRQDDTSAIRADDFMVESLEALMAVQKPASQPWMPVTDYSLEGRRPIEEPHAKLIRDVFNPHLVVDAGCGKHAILCGLLDELGVYNYGFDPLIDSERTKIGDRALYRADLTMLHDVVRSWQQGDLVICREVLEHLTIRKLVIAVRNLVKLSSKYVYVTTRFAKSHAHLLDVQTSDDLDPTHITMLTQPFLRLLFVLEGCKRRSDLETKMDWMHKGRVLVYEVPQA